MAGSHIALGAAAWLAAAPHLGLSAASPTCLGLAVFGALLPDIDHPKSWAGQRIRPVSHLIAKIFGHRGITHSLLAVAACAWLALQQQASPHLAWPLTVGYLSHLGADLLTPRGLRLLWPVRGTWALPLCRAGSPFEPLIVALILTWAWTTAKELPDLRNAWHPTIKPASEIVPRQVPLRSAPPPSHVASR
ncbi:metal-dependent hydrolase [Muricoccus radiodurans]|uniref:metal-dependent hydrolase n=1 Tax=Muricoccus radiodurans TaxID=2231721 RepID=UPI003CFB1C0A